MLEQSYKESLVPKMRIIDAVNAINNKYSTKHKVILATSPK